MSYIKICHGTLEVAAREIDSYLISHQNRMNSVGQEVSALSSSWQGKDFTQFQQEWDKANNYDSTSHKMVKALEEYAKFLRYAAAEYKDAQSKAVNQASWL
jgi:WXG100 family type VII secretion target